MTAVNPATAVKPKPLQDIFDTEKMRTAMAALERSNRDYISQVVTDLTSANLALADDNAALEEQVSSSRAREKSARLEIADMRSELDDLSDAASVSDRNISNLARARADLVKGDAVSARERIECVLNDLDGCWRLRV